MKKMLIVGGTVGSNKPSSIINKITRQFINKGIFESVTTFNGINTPNNINDNDLVLWFPDIPNEALKNYPIKDKGAVLICSKVIRANTTRIEAVTRIFNMNGNAVVLIYKNEGCFEFELVDALNNSWCKTIHVEHLVEAIFKLYTWTKDSKRVSLEKRALPPKFIDKLDYSEIYYFMGINRKIAIKVAEGCGNRFFGNYSTRCTKLFPSTRIKKETFFFSPRNIDKKFITKDDLILTDYHYYYNDRKPSVDTPVQLEIYKQLPNINFIIHGHAYIEDEVTTKNYYPCGDLREVSEVVDFVKKGFIKINLKNHGFIMLSTTIAQIEENFNKCVFKEL